MDLGNGGTIECIPQFDSFLVITNSSIADNTAVKGGGIYRSSNPGYHHLLAVDIRNTTITRNMASVGGGVAIGGDGVVAVKNSIISGNFGASYLDITPKFAANIASIIGIPAGLTPPTSSTRPDSRTTAARPRRSP